MSVLSLDAILSGSIAENDAVSWTSTGEVLRRSDLRADVGEMARRVTSAGCRRGAVVTDDTYSFLVAVLGLGVAGAAAIILPNARPGTLAQLAHVFDHVVADEPGPAERRIRIPRGAPPPPPIACDPNAMAIEFFTSGSTGAPKRIAKSVGQLHREAAALEARWECRGTGAAAVATVPHQHIYGLAFKVVWPLLTGRPFAAAMEEYWEGLVPALPAGGIIVSSPAHLTRLDGIEPLAPERRPRMVFSAGAPLPQPAARECARVFGVLPTEIYGSTETGALATRCQDGSAALWQPLPGVEARTSEEGRLQVRAHHVDEAVWVTTDDRVELSPDGFSLLGRADRVVKIEGKRVGLPEVEQSLAALPWVAQAVALVLPGERTTLAAAVVLSEAGRARLAELGAFRLGRLLRRELAHGQEAAGLPKRWRFVSTLPTGSMGKTCTADLVALFDGTCHD